ncbi:MAG: IS6 family transposase [Sedimentitalea sp.]|uniref:IS6 family transposase n=1 Tax=Sedimentitalea sp. TaxID=2048915 RepID=UPI003267ED41
MTKAKNFGAFKGHRFPPEIIAHAVWSYFRFPLSLRDAEDLLAARGIIVIYETIRKWVGKFGTKYDASTRRDRPAPSDKWHLDELVIPIRGRKFWLWRAIDSNGDALDILVQSRRNTRAAKRFFRKLFKKYGRPRVLITDKLGRYGAALKSLALGIDHRRHKGLNNRSEGSHRPMRRRGKITTRFKSPGQVQLFWTVHDQVQTVFRTRRHKRSAPAYRQSRSDAHGIWDDITCVLMAA